MILQQANDFQNVASIENAEPETKQKTTWQLIKAKLNSKELSSDHAYPFNFKTSNWYLTIVYLTSFILIPIVYSLIKTYGFHITLQDSAGKTTEPQPWGSLDLLFTFFIPLLGFAISFVIDWKTMIKKGAWAAYSHFIFGFISQIFVLLLLIQTGVIISDAKNPLFLAVGFLVQILFQFLGSILVVLSSKQLRKQIWATLKEAKTDLIFWIIIFYAIGMLLNLIFNQIPTGSQLPHLIADTNDNKSDNQATLELMTKTPLGIFAFCLGTMILAPINEEISYRFGTFSIVRYKWLGFIATLIYFPAMHVMQSGDWNDITGYLGLSIVLPFLFVCTRGNTTYTIGLHAVANSVAAIVFFIGLGS